MKGSEKDEFLPHSLNVHDDEKNQLIDFETNIEFIVPRKMGRFATFMAVLKAYCSINILLLPRSFANGGYLVSPLAMLAALFFEGMCAYKLCRIAATYGIYNYPSIANRALGRPGRALVRTFLCLAHFQFLVG